MHKQIFEESFMNLLNKNFLSLSKYFEFKLEVFCEFDTLIFEINKCLILELDRASITLTNHLLERLLKLALIHSESGIDAIPVEKWNASFYEPNKKYGKITLGNSIEKCKKIDLITEQEKNMLFGFVREFMRNGFSHADSSKILASLPDESKMFQGSLTNSKELKEVSINQKIIPTFQALQMENFAKKHSKLYFDFVFNLIFRIEKRLIEKVK